MLQQLEDCTVEWKERETCWFDYVRAKKNNDNLGNSYITENSISNVRGELGSRKQVEELVLNNREDTSPPRLNMYLAVLIKIQ